MTNEEQRAYSKGYNAGRKRVALSRSAEAKNRAENRFWQQVFCAALQGTLVSGKWQFGDKNWTRFSDYVRGSGMLADEALKQHRHRS